jgi:hypothetical protein
MKKFLFLIGIFYSMLSHANAGYAYRFYVNVEVNGENIKGYLYHGSYEKYDEGILLLDYLKKTSHNGEVHIYKEIRTVNLAYSNIDFTLKNSEIIVNLNQDIGIEIIETLLYNGDDRLIKISKEEFDLLKCTKPIIEVVYDEKISENCSYILLSWNESSNLKKQKNEIINKLFLFQKDIIHVSKNQNKYIASKKEALLSDKVLLINYCSVL